MRSGRIGIGLGLFAVMVATAGCGEWHGVQTDAGGRGEGVDTGPSGGGCRPGDPVPVNACLYASNHVCGDVAYSPECVGGAWVCPGGATLYPDCWCSGQVVHDPSCVCTPSGWSCPPDPPDAGPPACPSDPSILIGTPCAIEGQSCGSCPSPCSGFCNMATCVGGTWQTLELGCADPLFACGPSQYCSRSSEYCQHTLSDVGGIPDDWRCVPLPPTCAPDCSCFGGGPGDLCSVDPGGGVTVTSGGA